MASSTKPKASLLKQIVAAFEESGLTCETNEAEVAVTCGIASSPEADRYGAGFRCFISIGDGVLLLRVSSAYRVPLPSRHLAASALMHLNFQMQEGNVEMDVRDGELRYRLSYPLALRPVASEEAGKGKKKEEASEVELDSPLDVTSLSKQLLRQATSHYPVAADSLVRFIEASLGKENETTQEELQAFAAATVGAIAAEKMAADAR